VGARIGVVSRHPRRVSRRWWVVDGAAASDSAGSAGEGNG